ncbi:ATP-binding cassette domain-containing protein [Candidatus Saccharibacteria bacterium]|nr:ATP-binding cassette domain-containing protein [Candidatus Saccharibacteria bacterium]
MLAIKNIECKLGPEKKTILSDVSIDFSAGEFVAITGENGSGKSTLAKIIMGLIKPTSGKIFLGEKDITDLSISERAQLGVVYAFQTPVRFKGVTVASLLQVAATGEDVLDGKFDGKNAKFLEQVGLDPKEYLTREVNASLSGGELKRIEIASVFARASSAKILIFDEPEAGIDMWSLDNLLDSLKELKKTYRESTIIVISHNAKILEMADRTIVLSHGRVKD